ncbi:MAG: ABC transporter permease [Mesorhizobium sp.]|nr:ABC transporter permease [Mesorhizobium sp.]
MRVPVLLVGLLVVVLLGGLWQPHDPHAIDLLMRHAAPSPVHPLGTDHLGRDLLSRMMVAGWRSGLVVFVVGAIGFVGGTLIGTMAALMGGWREAIIVKVAETFIVVPTLIVALAVAAIFGLSPVSAGIALGLAGLGPYTLLSNSLTRRMLGQPFVLSARAMGAGTAGMTLRHILPSTAPVLFAYVGSNAGQAIVAYAALAFIGLGADPTRPDWGSMLFEYRMFVFDAPMLMLWPGLAIAIMAGLLNWAFDPEAQPTMT